MTDCSYCGYRYGHAKGCPQRHGYSAAPANPPNPKQRYGDTKPNVALVPPASIIYEALALGDGAEKYGPYNWRDKAVEGMTYIAAAMRHMMAWVDGEANASDSGKPHLAHAKACLGILIDAVEQGNLIDNRPKAGTAARVLKDWEKPPEPVNGADVLATKAPPPPSKKACSCTQGCVIERHGAVPVAGTYCCMAEAVKEDRQGRPGRRADNYDPMRGSY